MDAKTKPKGPMDLLMDKVEWESVATIGPGASALPYVTHTGKLTLPGFTTLIVHQLSDGRRIIPVEEMNKLFAVLEGTKDPFKPAPGEVLEAMKRRKQKP